MGRVFVAGSHSIGKSGLSFHNGRMKKWLLPLGTFLVSVGWLPGAWMDFESGKWMVVYLLGFVALVASFAAPVFPRVRRAEGIGLALLFAATLAHLFWFYPTGFEFVLLDRLSFFFLLFFSWRSFSCGQMRWSDFWWPLAAALLVIGAFGLWQVRALNPELVIQTQVGSLFGHANNAAQFTGLTLLLWWAIPRPRARPAVVAFYVVSALSVAYLVLSRGRSALLAFALGAMLLFLLKRNRRVAWPRALAVGAGAFLLYAALMFTQGKDWRQVAAFSLPGEKGSMTEYRADLWRRTLTMIHEHPLGVGVGRYAFEFVPYHRGGFLSFLSLPASPHSEPLRYLAEDGIPLTILFAVALVYLFYLWARRGAPGREIVLPSCLFLLVEGAVQFPWQNAYPVYLTAVGLGFIAATVWEPVSLWRRGFAPVIVAVALACLLLLGRAFASRLWERSPDPARAALSCQLAPANWRACLHQARLLLAANEFEPARRVITRVLDRDPWNYTAIRHLAVVAGRQGDNLEGCFLLWKYDDIFMGKSDLRPAYEKTCPPKWRSYFDRRRPERYYPRASKP